MPKKPAPAIEAKATRIVQRLRDRHRLGQSANRSKSSVEVLAARHGLSQTMLRKLKRFATAYSLADLEKFCKLRRPNGLPLHIGFIGVLLIVSDKNEREKLQKQAARGGWSAAQLAAAVPKKYRTANPHGRKMKQPETAADGLRLLTAEADRLCRRIRVAAALKGLAGKRGLRKQIDETLGTLERLKGEIRKMEGRLRKAKS